MQKELKQKQKAKRRNQQREGVRWADDSGPRLKSIKVFETEPGIKMSPTPRRGQEHHWRLKELQGLGQRQQQRLVGERAQTHARANERALAQGAKNAAK